MGKEPPQQHQLEQFSEGEGFPFRIVPYGIKIDSPVPLEQVGDTINYLFSIEDSIQLAIGDFLLWAESKHGEAIWQHIPLNRSLGTMRNYKYVSRNVPMENRKLGLPWSFLQEVACVRDKDEQHDWLHSALEEKWTRDELRDEMHKHTLPAGNDGVIAIKQYTRGEIVSTLEKVLQYIPDDDDELFERVRGILVMLSGDRYVENS